MNWTKNHKLLRDVFEWDITNWSNSLVLWLPAIVDQHGSESKALAVGERNGGVSLLLALYGYSVVCSDLNGPTPQARALHDRYGVAERLTYEKADICDLSEFHEQFDLVAFRSVLGSLGSWDRQRIAGRELYSCLVPGGKLIFAENLIGARLHQYLRRKFIPWSSHWRYMELNELREVFCDFKRTTIRTSGVLGALGRTERQREILSTLDWMVKPLFPISWRYIGFGVCEK